MESKILKELEKIPSKPITMLEFASDVATMSFTYQQLKNAESEGYKKGFKEGVEVGISQGEIKATREIDTLTREIISKLESALKDIFSSEKFFHENFFVNILRICFIVLKKSMPYFFNKAGHQEIENLLTQVVEALIIKQPIKLKVSDRIFDSLCESLKELVASYPEKIEVVSMAGFDVGSCEVEWQGGGAKWNLDERYQEIESRLEDYLKHLTQGGQNG